MAMEWRPQNWREGLCHKIKVGVEAVTLDLAKGAANSLSKRPRAVGT